MEVKQGKTEQTEKDGFEGKNHWPFVTFLDTKIADELPSEDMVKLDIYPEQTKAVIGNYKVDKKYEKSTSQGQVYYLKDTNHPMVMKVSQLVSLVRKPWKIQDKPSIQKPIYIPRECIEAFIYGMLSKYYKNNEWPHFAIVYDTFLAETKTWKLEREKKQLKKESDVLVFPTRKRTKRKLVLLDDDDDILIKPETPSHKFVQDGKDFAAQVICMEKLDSSLPDILSKQKDINVWWSILCQLVLTLAFLQKRFHFVHNDAHPDNTQVRFVPKDTYLYYEIDKDTFICVPTFGFVLVFIDFGRASFVLNGQRYVSSEYSEGGLCYGWNSDSKFVDLSRFVATLERSLSALDSPFHQDEIRNWIKLVTKNKISDDLFSPKGLLRNGFFVQAAGQEFFAKSCTEAIPSKHIPFFVTKYRIQKKEIPEHEKIYVL